MFARVGVLLTVALLALVVAVPAGAQAPPDGSGTPVLAYERLCGDVPCGVVVTDRGGSERQVTEGRDRLVGWFPGGERLLVARFVDDQRSDLYEVDVDGGGETLVLEDSGTQPVLSPRGDRVAYVDDADSLLVRNLGTGVTTPVDVAVEEFTRVAWSPNGALLAVPAEYDGAGQTGVRVVDPTVGVVGELRTPVVDPATCDGAGSVFGVAWAPDGATVLATRSGTGTPCSAVTWALPVDGGAAVEIGRGVAQQDAWSPDGSAIALTRFGAAAADDNLAVVTPAGEEVGFGALAFAVNVLGWAPDASAALVVETTFPEGDPLSELVAYDAPTVTRRVLRTFDATLGNAVLAPGAVTRAAGPSRIDTGVAVSRSTWETATAVVVAPAGSYAEPLAAAPLAGTEDAPVLLTYGDGLAPQVAAEIDRLGAEQAFLVGGEDVLSAQVEADLTGAGLQVARLGGDDVFATAAAVARVVGGAQAYVVEGASTDPARGWPDAVSVSGLAALTGRPVLLVERDRLPDATADAIQEIGVDEVTIVGGEAAVSAGVADAIAGLGVTVGRAAGETRYGTSAAVAGLAEAAGADPATTWVASGTNYPDSLTAGPAAASEGATLLLTDRDQLAASPETAALLTPERVARVRLAGGTLVLTGALQLELERRLPWP